MSKITLLKHHDIDLAAHTVALQMAGHNLTKAYPIPRGGVAAAYAVMRHYAMLRIVETPEEADCYIDDLIDSGNTANQFSDKPFFALFTKNETYRANSSNTIIFAGIYAFDQWLVFPWETTVESSATDIGTRLLQFIGEDPNREGLKETPARMLRAWQEWTSGYAMDPVEALKVEFTDGSEGYDEMVMVDPIPFYSNCEHHLTPIIGTVHIAYIPQNKIAGLSKFCRLVEVFARRLQVQERMTVQIATTIQDVLAPLGCGVVVRAEHLCMSSRGAKTHGAVTTTISLKGVFKNEPATRAEFLAMIKGR